MDIRMPGLDGLPATRAVGGDPAPHVSRAMIKLGARDRAQLVVYACESGLVRPGWRS
jgi:CheY-like chemotaxis protein